MRMSELHASQKSLLIAKWQRKRSAILRVGQPVTVWKRKNVGGVYSGVLLFSSAIEKRVGLMEGCVDVFHIDAIKEKGG